MQAGVRGLRGAGAQGCRRVGVRKRAGVRVFKKARGSLNVRGVRKRAGVRVFKKARGSLNVRGVRVFKKARGCRRV